MTFNNRITMSGDVHLILKNGKTLTAKGGIYVPAGSTFTVYTEGDDTGKIVSEPDSGAGIGGIDDAKAGNIIIKGGDIKLKGGNGSAALGGAADDDSGFGGIEIYGGSVDAFSGQEAAAIGGGEDNDQTGEIRIYGGNVRAVGHRGAGIGGGYKAAAGPISIFGGVIFAEVRIGYVIGGAAIGSGGEAGSHTINITGGRIIADAAEGGGAGIGAGYDGDSGEINISGDDTQVFAYGGNYGGAGIGAGYAGDQAGTITIDGGYVEAYGNDTEGNGGGAGIGGGRESYYFFSGDGGAAATININGGIVIAGTTRSGEKELTSRPIGSGIDEDDCGQLNIYGTAKVTAGSKKSNAELQNKGDRVSSIQQESANWAKIEPCDHSSADYSLSDEENHIVTCKNCDYSGAEGHHFENNVCAKCGYDGYTVSFDKGDIGRGTMNPLKALPGEYTLPECGFTASPQPVPYYFKNWEVLVDGEVKGTGRPGDKITITADTVLTAVWDENQYAKVRVDKSVKNGSISVQEEGALVKKDDDVHVTVQPDEGYVLNKLTYTKKSDGTEVDLTESVSENPYTFKMPDEDITVSGKFIHKNGCILTIHWSSMDGVDLEEPIVIRDIAPGTAISEALVEAGMSYDPEDDLFGEDVFEKEGYKGTGCFAPDPITTYENGTRFNGARFKGSDLVNGDMELYYAMNKLYDEVEVSIDPPKCTEETSIGNYNTIVNPPREVIPNEAGYRYYRGDNQGVNDYRKRWCTDDAGNNVYEGSFTAGSSYKARLYLEPTFGYGFAEDASLVINGTEALHQDHRIIANSTIIGGTGTVEAVHDWGEPKYEWGSELGKLYAMAKASRYCKNENHNTSEIEVKPSSSEITKEPTDTEMGETTYTVVFDNKAFETQTITDANIPKTISKVELTLDAPVCGDVIVGNTSVVNIPEDAGYQSYYNAAWKDASGGSGTFEGGSDYCAELRIEPKINYAFTDDVKVYVNGELLDSGAVSKELDRLVINASVTAVHDLKIEQEGEAPTCESDGVVQHYKCSACGKLFWSLYSRYEIENPEDIVITGGHVWSTPTYKWSDDNSKVTATRICGRDDTHVETETVSTTSEKTKDPTCEDNGETTYTSAGFTNEAFEIQTKIEADIPALGHEWGKWTVTKQPTETAAGTETRECSVCHKTETRAVPAKGYAPGADPNQKGTDGTAVGPGASAAAADKAITSLKSDADPKGTVFAKLRLKSTKQTKKSVKLSWTKVSKATKYVIYGNKCGKANKPKKLATVTGNTKTFSKVAGKKIKKGTYYKFIIVALDKDNNVVSTSKIVHVATKGGKVGNHKKVTVKKSVIKKARKLKKGKSLKLKAKAVAQSKKLKVKKHVKVRYESTNKEIATVSKKGAVKGKKKGTCYVYAYAQNGVAKKIKVVVK